MSKTAPQLPATKVRNYQNQNGGSKLTPAQDSRVAKADAKAAGNPTKGN
jgi:hypothetical protein